VPEQKKVVVVGLGEVGRPIFELTSKRYSVLGVDIAPPAERVSEVDILHICFPFGIDDFIGETCRYIKLFSPKLTIINSTVAVGTTRALVARTGTAVVNSPVRGKHAHMTEDLLRYVKFVGAVHAFEAHQAAEHFRSLGMKTAILSSPEATELAKLTETTYFGLMIAWAQQIERYCDQLDQDYDEVASFYAEVNFFPPVKYLPGIIGGHCVMPNIKILSQLGASEIVEAIVSSNRMKTDREERLAKAHAETKSAISTASLATAEKPSSVRLAAR
jgi:UDP-N-acetyl-D-mannosaminuronate dehydrogenase